MHPLCGRRCALHAARSRGRRTERRERVERATVFQFLRRMAEGIARTFGRNCETLIHDMTKPDHPILVIHNGHVTGRTVGSVVDIFGSSEQKDDTVFTGADFVNHVVVTPQGRHIKTTTMHFRGEDYHYALGINFDFTAFVSADRAIADFTAFDSDLQSAITQVGQLNRIYEQCVAALGKPVSQMQTQDRMRLIAMMRQRDAFRIQKSVPFISAKLRVSRNTIYKYLREAGKAL